MAWPGGTTLKYDVSQRNSWAKKSSDLNTFNKIVILLHYGNMKLFFTKIYNFEAILSFLKVLFMNLTEGVSNIRCWKWCS